MLRLWLLFAKAEIVGSFGLVLADRSKTSIEVDIWVSKKYLVLCKKKGVV